MERPRTTTEVLAWCQANGLEQAELVGRWVWVQFAEKPSESVRKAMVAAGFRWHGKRREWFHNCGIRSRARKDGVNPRDVYGSIPVAELEVTG